MLAGWLVLFAELLGFILNNGKLEDHAIPHQIVATDIISYIQSVAWLLS